MHPYMLTKDYATGAFNYTLPGVEAKENFKPFKRAKMEAICGSEECLNVNGKYVGVAGTRKDNVKYPDDRCPDCGYFLFWRRGR